MWSITTGKTKQQIAPSSSANDGLAAHDFGSGTAFVTGRAGFVAGDAGLRAGDDGLCALPPLPSAARAFEAARVSPSAF